MLDDVAIGVNKADMVLNFVCEGSRALSQRRQPQEVLVMVSERPSEGGRQEPGRHMTVSREQAFTGNVGGQPSGLGRALPAEQTRP